MGESERNRGGGAARMAGGPPGPRRPDPPRGWSLNRSRGRPVEIPLCPGGQPERGLTARGVKPEQRGVLARCTSCGRWASLSRQHRCRAIAGNGRARATDPGGPRPGGDQLAWYDEEGGRVLTRPERSAMRPVNQLTITHPGLCAPDLEEMEWR